MPEPDNEILPPVFVINRCKDTHRRSDMIERLGKVGISPVFIEAVDGYALDIKNLPDYDGEKRRRYFAKDLGHGEIGCSLSHRKIYEKMINENISSAIVFEDDVFVEDNLKDLLEDIHNTNLPWDLIRFVGHGKVFDIGFRPLLKLRHQYSIVRVPTSPSGAYAYMLTQKAAKTLLGFMQKNWVPVDIVHSRAWETRLDTFLIHPSPATPDLISPSTIGDDRFDKQSKITGVTKLLHPFYRFWYKLSNGVGKRFLYLSTHRNDVKMARKLVDN
ncbi:glycosyltransferase family 25 protein [Sneathiella marina]|uniref:Glycosyltransferase family 25 protein n=1 Tax=Sneathiella marina TaxID=2950108 RepID=A0ABY4W6V9_9PROT|nr:glycosyltransferase family 25 protein [Sneathiella marina]USG61868.1 glycosyltransferase family 25 protein [Sneathiella marina]